MVVLIHLWVLLCSIIGTKHLYTNSNFLLTVFFVYLFEFYLTLVSDWFFSLPWSSDTLGVFSAMLSVCFFVCLLFALLTVWKHAFHYMVSKRLQRHKDQRVLHVWGTRPGIWCLPDSGAASKIQKPTVFACGASETFLRLFETRGFGLIIRQVSSDTM